MIRKFRGSDYVLEDSGDKIIIIGHLRTILIHKCK